MRLDALGQRRVERLARGIVLMGYDRRGHAEFFGDRETRRTVPIAEYGHHAYSPPLPAFVARRLKQRAQIAASAGNQDHYVLHARDSTQTDLQRTVGRNQSARKINAFRDRFV